jgi:hypothetical protein
MMHMMGDDVDFFRKRFDDKVLCKESIKGAPEKIRFMRAIPVEPNGAMRAHNDEGIQQKNYEQGP